MLTIGTSNDLCVKLFLYILTEFTFLMKVFKELNVPQKGNYNFVLVFFEYDYHFGAKGDTCLKILSCYVICLYPLSQNLLLKMKALLPLRKTRKFHLFPGVEILSKRSVSAEFWPNHVPTKFPHQKIILIFKLKISYSFLHNDISYCNLSYCIIRIIVLLTILCFYEFR